MIVYSSVCIVHTLIVFFKSVCCPDPEERGGTDSKNKSSRMNLCARIVKFLFDLFQFVWLIVGSVWVLGKYDDWDDAGRPNCNGLPSDSDKCCHEGMFLFAFIFIIVTWIILFLVICCTYSFLVFVCCTSVLKHRKFIQKLRAARRASGQA